MKTSDRFELDNLFSRNGIGEVYPENPDYPDIWKTDQHDYVTLKISYLYKDRFQSFWDSAQKTLGSRLKVFYIQHGTPFLDAYIDETWYFINEEGARGLLEWFDDIIPTYLPKIKM